jgi:hypothetical protein
MGDVGRGGNYFEAQQLFVDFSVAPQLCKPSNNTQSTNMATRATASYVITSFRGFDAVPARSNVSNGQRDLTRVFFLPFFSPVP